MSEELAPLPGLDHLEALMREALEQAARAGQDGELPIGAVVAIDGAVVGRGRARQRARRSQLAHAELQALLEAGEPLYEGHDRALLVTTLEPCPLCLGAAVMADVPRIVFGLCDPLAAIPDTVEREPYVRRHIATYLGGVLEPEVRQVMHRESPGFLAFLERM